MAKREIAVQRAGQEVPRKGREARQKEAADLLLDTAQNKEQDVLRMGEC